jgi:aminopeptidase N
MIGVHQRKKALQKLLALCLVLVLLPFAPRQVGSEYLPGALSAPATNARDVASYAIDVRLDVEQRRLEGRQVLSYRNTTEQPIPDLIFHLYLNAFRDADTLFMQGAGGSHRGFSFTEGENGWIEVNRLALADGTVLTLDLLEDGTLARAALPSPVEPGESVVLTMDFTAQLPRVFARTGWALDEQGELFFMVGQWFPKLGVWTADGWNAYPFYTNAEFFANFGSYTVQITLPDHFVTGASGMPVAQGLNDDGTQTVTYQADDVIDFAWTASPSFIETVRQVGDTELLYLVLPEHEWTQSTVLDSAEDSLVRFSEWFGPYPYARLTLVDVPSAGQGAGGMEYPTLVTVGGAYSRFPAVEQRGWENVLETVTIHEVAHQWWQSMVAFNEVEEPWLDEGLADYSTARVMLDLYGLPETAFDMGRLNAGWLDGRRSVFLNNPGLPLYGPSFSFEGRDYVIAAYAKPNLALLTLEGVLGEATMLELLQVFFERYAFDHPTTEDLRAVAEEVAGADQVAWFFDGLVYGSQTVNYVAEEITANSLTAARQGDLVVPVELEVVFRDGSTLRLEWDGLETPRTFTFDDTAPLESFKIDPDRTLWIELDWTDNFLAAPEVTDPPEPELPEPPPPPVNVGLAPDTAVYSIDVTLDVNRRRLDGVQTLTYRNDTNRPFTDIVFHLYLNAFENEDTLFLRNSGGMMRGSQWDAENNGWIEVTNLMLVDGTPLTLEPLEDGTLARTELPNPVEPGQSVTIELAFTAQLPYVFARTGWALDARGEPFFMVGQWFPKAGVWTEEGWNAYPFYPNAEFFADFGAYEVRITLPQGYVTGASGMPADQVTHNDGTQTVTYHAEDVIDFAWTASPSFRSATRQIGETELLYMVLPEHEWTTRRVLDAATEAVTHFSAWFGPYPYPRLTLVDVPDAGQGAGGMEYPTLVTVGAMDITGLALPTARLEWDRGLELVTIHEVGHQWWQSMVAFNEVEEPWLDEGFTDYSTGRLLNLLYGQDASAIQIGNFHAGYLDLRRVEYVSNPHVRMYGAAWEFNGLSYAVAAYSKPHLSLLTLERVLGEDTMLLIMRTFFERYVFQHPTTEDFRAVAEEVAGADQVAWFFDGLVYSDDSLNYVARSIDGSSITVARQGELQIPTEIEVQFAGGENRRVNWDGSTNPATGTHTFTFAGDPPIEAFHIDPERKLLVELVWSDNSLSRGPDWSAWLTLASRLVYRLQDWLLVLGGI